MRGGCGCVWNVKRGAWRAFGVVAAAAAPPTASAAYSATAPTTRTTAVHGVAASTRSHAQARVGAASAAPYTQQEFEHAMVRLDRRALRGRRKVAVAVLGDAPSVAMAMLAHRMCAASGAPPPVALIAHAGIALYEPRDNLVGERKRRLYIDRVEASLVAANIHVHRFSIRKHPGAAPGFALEQVYAAEAYRLGCSRILFAKTADRFALHLLRRYADFNPDLRDLAEYLSPSGRVLTALDETVIDKMYPFFEEWNLTSRYPHMWSPRAPSRFELFCEREGLFYHEHANLVDSDYLSELVVRDILERHSQHAMERTVQAAWIILKHVQRIETAMQTMTRDALARSVLHTDVAGFFVVDARYFTSRLARDPVRAEHLRRAFVTPRNFNAPLRTMAIRMLTDLIRTVSPKMYPVKTSKVSLLYEFLYEGKAGTRNKALDGKERNTLIGNARVIRRYRPNGERSGSVPFVMADGKVASIHDLLICRTKPSMHEMKQSAKLIAVNDVRSWDNRFVVGVRECGAMPFAPHETAAAVAARYLQADWGGDRSRELTFENEVARVQPALDANERVYLVRFCIDRDLRELARLAPGCLKSKIPRYVRYTLPVFVEYQGSGLKYGRLAAIPHLGYRADPEMVFCCYSYPWFSAMPQDALFPQLHNDDDL
ncbi:hypothetical protein FVE85_5297 [Porphyridium purpureum]|uniref:Uncharacterized protein n=1 Tax=Porphyridium purpureum TaxID=35688 RepID=A0A5J4Z3D0_PORPP|nr:hypothetical protein FVE85_5297 [Porphyridium purpureum]|eukprot:POR5543..scf295_1